MYFREVHVLDFVFDVYDSILSLYFLFFVWAWSSSTARILSSAIYVLLWIGQLWGLVRSLLCAPIQSRHAWTESPCTALTRERWVSARRSLMSIECRLGAHEWSFELSLVAWAQRQLYSTHDTFIFGILYSIIFSN